MVVVPAGGGEGGSEVSRGPREIAVDKNMNVQVDLPELHQMVHPLIQPGDGILVSN